MVRSGKLPQARHNRLGLHIQQVGQARHVRGAALGGERAVHEQPQVLDVHLVLLAGLGSLAHRRTLHPSPCRARAIEGDP